MNSPYHIGLNFPGLHFETPEAGAHDAGAGADPSAEGAAAAQTAAPEVEAATPAWAPSQDEWGQVIGAVNYLAEAYEALTPQEQAAVDAGADWDPLADNAGEQLRDLVRSELREALAPINATVAVTQHEQSVQLRDGIFDSFNDLDFDRDMAHSYAISALPEMQAQYGRGAWAAQAAVQAALRTGAERAAEVRKTERQAGRDAYVAEMEALRNAPKTPPGLGESGTEISPQITDPRALARAKSRAFVERINAA